MSIAASRRNPSVRRVVWVLPHPTPYNTYLLNGLVERLPAETEAIFRWERLPSHPWARLPERRFAWREAYPAGGRDRQLEELAAEDTEALLIFAGWRNRTMLAPLVRRLRRGLPYAFWTDTPKVGAGLPRRLVNGAYCFFARRAVTTLATGTPAVECYRAMGLPAAKIDSLPYIVDADHFATAREGRDWDTAGSRLGVCGRLAQIKGQTVALEALARAREKAAAYPLELLVAGTGPDEPMLRQQAAGLGVSNAVHFLGWVEYDRFPSLLRECGALVMPSWRDAYGVAVLEAMAAGLPVLGSRGCAAVRECVVHGHSGFVHEPGDAAALAEHMLWIAGRPDEARRMGQRAIDDSRAWGIEAAAAVVERVVEKAEVR